MTSEYDRNEYSNKRRTRPLCLTFNAGRAESRHMADVGRQLRERSEMNRLSRSYLISCSRCSDGKCRLCGGSGVAAPSIGGMVDAMMDALDERVGIKSQSRLNLDCKECRGTGRCTHCNGTTGLLSRLLRRANR